MVRESLDPLGPTVRESLDPLGPTVRESLDPLGPTIFAGDLNADPGTSAGPLSTTPSNEQGKILSRYLSHWGFSSVHLHLNDKSTPHTFENHSKNSIFTIDHILCSNCHIPLFRECSVLHDALSNSSDRHPLVTTLDLKVHRRPPPHQSSSFSSYNWRKLSQPSKYTSSLSNKLKDITVPSAEDCKADHNLIDSFLSNITGAPRSACEESVPKKEFDKHKKPGWNTSINSAHKRSKAAWRCWKNAGSPRCSVLDYRHIRS